MDPDRVRAYLQVACAGLGFDIGEIWWSTNDDAGGSTALAAFEEKHDQEQNALALSEGKKMRFVQLYTSRSYEDRRNQLVTPADEEENYKSQVNANGAEDEGDADENHAKKEHVLSPLLVDAISKTAQVVWAHTKKQEGLLGRSDMRLQTAVGMPVAVDGSGNMCVVVMFSPNNISSTDDALEYLQSISRSATSASIPSLLPAFDPKQGLVSLPHHHSTNEMIPLLSSPNMSDGQVITRFVSLDDAPIGVGQLSVAEVHSDHELANAPKDCFGIPMLPSVTLLEGHDPLAGSEAFDEASYGVWSTIMENADYSVVGDELLEPAGMSPGHNFLMTSMGPAHDSTAPVFAINKPTMDKERLDRLEEFSEAFLDVSVFDFAEVWVPIGDQSDHLGQATSIISSDSKSNKALQDFESQSEKILVKYWSGAVGRAFSSGNPVWSANQDVFVDSGRAALFSQVKIETALAVPVFSGKSNTPSFVFCCYSFVKSGSVPFVLKFVQQALRLLWDGLDKVQPHKSVGEELWKDVAPADLGEMAADVEMQQHFLIKKRPHNAIENGPAHYDPTDSSLAMGFESLRTPSGVQSVRSIYTGAGSGLDPLDDDDDYEPNSVPIHFHHIQNVQSHIQHAVQSIGDLKPAHHHVNTNAQGSKRAHVVIERLDSPVEFDTGPSQPDETTHEVSSRRESGFMTAPAPLPMPRPLPLPNATLRQPVNGMRASPSPQLQPIQTMPAVHLPQQQQQQQLQSYQTSQPTAQGYQIQNQPQSQPIYFAQHHNPSADGNDSGSPYSPLQMQQHGQSSHHRQQQLQLQQQHPENFPNHSSQGQTTSQTSYDVGYGQSINATGGYPGHQQPQQQPQQQPHQHHQPHQHLPQQLPQQLQLQQLQLQQQQPHQQEPHQQQYHSIHSNEPLSFPSNNHGQAPNYASQSTPLPPQQSAMTHTNFSSVPANKISATGMIFTIPQSTSQGSHAQANGGLPTNGSGRHVGHNPVNMAPNHGNGGPQFCVVVATPASSSASGRQSGSKPCRIQGCSEPALVRRPYCERHSGNRMCEHEGCPKCAQGSTRFCIAHGGGRRCTFPGCDKGARDKFFCAAHGGGKRCKFDGCNKSAVGGSQLCTAHGGGRRCSVDGCDKSAQSSTKFCVKHGGGKKCAQDGCDKVARGRTQYCAAHGGGVRCKLAGCNRVAIGKVQLCRAHGGGTRSRRSSKGSGGGSHHSGSLEDSQSDLFGDDDFDDHHEGTTTMPGFADMTSV